MGSWRLFYVFKGIPVPKLPALYRLYRGLPFQEVPIFVFRLPFEQLLPFGRIGAPRLFRKWGFSPGHRLLDALLECQVDLIAWVEKCGSRAIFSDIETQFSAGGRLCKILTFFIGRKVFALCGVALDLSPAVAIFRH